MASKLPMEFTLEQRNRISIQDVFQVQCNWSEIPLDKKRQRNRENFRGKQNTVEGASSTENVLGLYILGIE